MSLDSFTESMIRLETKHPIPPEKLLSLEVRECSRGYAIYSEGQRIDEIIFKTREEAEKIITHLKMVSIMANLRR